MWSTKSLALASAVSVALTGCIELPGEDDDDGPSSSLAGKAADGYLASANVCLDLNANKVCDRGEPSATTGPDGDFTINAEASQIESAALLVEIIAGTTIDKDTPNTPIDKAYSLSAPPGYKFISPITTLVQAEVEKSGGSVEAAVSNLKSRLGTEIDFEDDYVAGQDDEENSAENKAAYEQLHKVARVVATIMKKNLDAVSVNQDSDNFEEVMKLVVAKVDVALETIKSAVENDTSGTFNPDTIAANEDIDNSTKVDPDTLEDELALKDDLDAATDANMGAALESGLWWVEYHFDEFESNPEIGYGKTMFDGTNTSNMFYYWSGSAFVLDNGTTNNVESECSVDCEPDNTELVLLDTGWEVANFDEGGDGEDDGPNFTGTDGNAVLMDQGPIQVRLAGEEFDLTGNKIRGTLSGTADWEWAGLVNTTATFGTDSKGYKLRMSVADDVFIMPDFTSGCDEEDGVVNSDLTAIAGNCNLMRFINAPGGTVEGDDPTDIQASSFSPISSTRASGNNPMDYKGIILGFEEDSDTGFIAEFGTDNKIFYYKVTVTNDEVQAFEKVLEAPYEQKTVHGKTLIVFDVPFKLGIPFFDDHEDECSDCSADGTAGNEEHRDDGPKPTALFLTAHEGYWRYGFAIEEGTIIPDDAPFVYNENAMDSIIDAFDDSLIPSASGVQ